VGVRRAIELRLRPDRLTDVIANFIEELSARSGHTKSDDADQAGLSHPSAAGVLDHGAVEELPVGARVKAHRVREHEGMEVGVIEELPLDELMRLLEHFGDVGPVPQADVGGEDRAEARASFRQAPGAPDLDT
jgi:hypothetical protein